MQSFDSLPLHDAVLSTVEMDWTAGSCVLRLETAAAIDPHAGPRELRFEGVQRLELPRTMPWGRSSQINGTSSHAGVFRCEMQSGDTIELTAESFALSAGPAA